MTEPGYTVKERIEILATTIAEQFTGIATQLDKIEAKLDEKASNARVLDIEKRVESIAGRVTTLELTSATDTGASRVKLWAGNSAVLIASSVVGAFLYYIVQAGGHG